MAHDDFIQKKIEEALSSAIGFGETFLRDPNMKRQFKAFFPQRRILNASKKITYVCVDGNTEIVDPYTLRPTPVSFTPYLDKTLCFDFEENKVKWVGCQWRESGYKDSIKLHLSNGLDLTTSDDHMVFERKKGWVEVKYLKCGDQILTPSEIPIFGDYDPSLEEIDNEIQAIKITSIISDPVFKYSEYGLLMFLSRLWNEFGSFHQVSSVKLMLWNRDVAKDIVHLLLRIGVSGRIDIDGNLFIDDEIDVKLFLHSIGIDVLITDVRSTRKYETILEIRKLGRTKVYDLAVAHPDHNFIANNCVVHNCVHRRAGKSYALSLLALYHAQPWQSERKFRIHVFAPGSTQIREFFKYIDDWIGENPMLKAAMNPTGNQTMPPIRTFLNGSTIEGHIMGISEASKGRKKGITADAVIVDEAQGLTEFDWRVINPIIEGDASRQTDDRKVKAYIAGTIEAPIGQFYKKTKGKTELSDDEDLIFIPITENEDFTADAVEKKRLQTPEAEWHTEWLLEVGDMDTAVFRKSDVDRAFSIKDFAYEIEGDAMIKTRCTRYIGIDWDMKKAGTSIVVSQYDPLEKSLEVIYREEVPKGAFTYAVAVARIPQLMDTYSPNYVVMDGGAGEYQYQDLVLKLPEHYSSRLIKKYMHNAEKIENPMTGDPESKKFKQLAVGMLQQKLQEGRFLASGTDTELKEQLLTYAIVRVTNNTVTYSSTKEHIIDAIMFCLWGVWLDYENPTTGGNIETKKVVSKEESAHPWRDPDNIDPYSGINMNRLALFNELRDDLDYALPEYGFGNRSLREPF